MSIQKYREQRDFRRTGEPSGKTRKAERPGRSDGALFVIQKHDATSLHYDFRLEADGVLKSWAVPKGPSTDPADKRLAIRTEDHPLDYADFEGLIPSGEYGAGPVQVWDRGTYEPLGQGDNGSPAVSEAIENGHLEVRLHGHKLSGAYALHRTGEGEDARWLLIKMDDDQADARRNPVSTEPESVISGRTIEQIADEEDDDG